MGNNTFYMQGKIIFIISFIILLLIYLFFIQDLMENSLSMFELIKMIFITILFLMGCYIGSFSVELTKDNFITKRWFGLGKTSVYELKDIKKIIFKTDYTELVSNIIIVFNNNENIQIHKFQSNFYDALYIIRERFKDTPTEYKDKSAFFIKL